ncbi:Pvc16 family protein [Streptomyces vinaceus]
MNILHLVDEALGDELRAGPLGAMNAQVSFETPNSDWAARRTGLWVNLFLHGIDEDVPRRQTGDRNIVDEQGAIVGYDPPTRYFRLGYALTVWGQSPRDEHSVLGAMLEWCISTDQITAQAGPQRTKKISLGLRPTSEDAESPAAKLWAGLGTPPRPVLDLMLIVPITAPTKHIDTEPVRGLTLRSQNLQSPSLGSAPYVQQREGVRSRRRVEEIR